MWRKRSVHVCDDRVRKLNKRIKKLELKIKLLIQNIKIINTLLDENNKNN